MQIINVDLIPGKVMPVLHSSQFDIGRQLGVKLYNGGAVYNLTGAEVVSVSVRKPDGNIVTETLTNAGGNELEIITTEQMTACAGASLCEIKIEDAGDVIGSANFVLEVEEDPLDGGIASQSEIDNLATQVAGLVATEVANQYDSANVIFDNDPTTGHGVGYAVTSEGVKNAIDAVGNPAASAVSYDNTGSGMTATNVQDAIDELDTNIGSLSTLTTTDKSSIVGAVNELQYHIGDSIALNNLFTGYISSSSKRVRFTIPLDKPLDSNITGINFSSTGDMTLYGASGADTISSPALTGWTFSLTRGSLFIQYDSSTAVTLPNQSMCAAFFSTSGSKITFT